MRETPTRRRLRPREKVMMRSLCRSLALAAVAGLLFTAPASAATIKVCAAGCDDTNSQLQTALDAANPSDTILLQEGFTYVGVFILPNQKSCPAQDATCYITLKTGVNASGVVQPTTN